LEEVLDPLAVVEMVPAVVSDDVAADFIGSRVIRHRPAPFLQGPAGPSDPTPRISAPGHPHPTRGVLFQVALPVLPVLADDLGDDVDDQDVHDYPDPDECRQQGKRLREGV
jgi:hypothetical protein